MEEIEPFNRVKSLNVMEKSDKFTQESSKRE